MEKLELLKPTVITDGGPWAEHNMPCPVCLKKSAVLNIGTGVYQPCWDCQKRGVITLQLPKWLRRWLTINRKFEVQHA